MHGERPLFARSAVTCEQGVPPSTRHTIFCFPQAPLAPNLDCQVNMKAVQNDTTGTKHLWSECHHERGPKRYDRNGHFRQVTHLARKRYPYYFIHCQTLCLLIFQEKFITVPENIIPNLRYAKHNFFSTLRSPSEYCLVYSENCFA